MLEAWRFLVFDILNEFCVGTEYEYNGIKYLHLASTGNARFVVEKEATYPATVKIIPIETKEIQNAK